MKIGILTFHHVTNYGALMQTYGLFQACKEIRPDAELEIINYQPIKAVKNYLKSGFIRRKDPSYIFKLFRFSQFRLKYLKSSGLPIYKSSGLAKLSDRYDAVITGSDEVWRMGGLRGFDKSYFLGFCDSNVKKISYAPSCSNRTKREGYDEEIIGYLKDLKYLSVRDRYSADLVKEMTGRNAVEVLDPTCLCNFSSLNKKINIPEEGFILLYGELNEGDVTVIRDYAHVRGLKIISVNKKLSYADISYPNIRPEQWLFLMSRADLVITEFFHGMMFALKNNKPFLMFRHPGKTAKVEGITKKLDIDSFLLDSPITHDRISVVMDSFKYDEINGKLAVLKEKSFDFLKGALKS